MQKTLLAIAVIGAINGLSAETLDKLDDVIVTATRSEIDTADAPGSVTVINKKQIEQKGAANVLDVIRGTAGVSMQGVGSGGRKGISLRGMSTKHTLILIDGKRVPSSNDVIGPNTDYQYDWIPASRIERVEVVRGPMSVLYGADALGGVVNIITRKASKQTEGSFKITGRLPDRGVVGNDGAGHNIGFNLSGSASDNLQLSLGAQQSRRESLDSVLKAGQSAIEGKEKQQLTLGLEWELAHQQHLNLDISTGQEKRWQDTATRKKKFYQSQYDIDRQQLSLGWKATRGEINTALRAYQSKVDISNHATNGVRATAPQKLKETVLEGSISFPVGQKQFITTGLEHRTEKLTNSNLKKGQDDITLNSVYLQDEIDVSDQLLFTLGARLDDHQAFGKELSPRASLVWEATDELTLKASYGHGFKAPNIKQSSSDYVFSLGRIKVSGNSKLKPETNNALELGANYSADRFSIDAAIFDNKIKNLIELTGPITDRTYQNISQARLKGGEISTKVALFEGLDFNASYQYLDAKDGNGKRLKHRPRHTVSSGLTWDKHDWQWHLGAEHLSGQVIEHNRVSTDVPAYTLWNASVSKPINKRLKLSVGIENLTDVRLEKKSPAFLHEEYPRTFRLELSGSF